MKLIAIVIGIVLLAIAIFACIEFFEQFIASDEMEI